MNDHPFPFLLHENRSSIDMVLMKWLQISSGTRGRLQAMASCAEQWDYGRALHYHREMVATCDMAEISAFMPALKMLLSSLQTSAR